MEPFITPIAEDATLVGFHWFIAHLTRVFPLSWAWVRVYVPTQHDGGEDQKTKRPVSSFGLCIAAVQFLWPEGL